MPELVACPLGKEPCHLAKPDCNLSPGYHHVSYKGTPMMMCGECVKETGAKVLATARSLKLHDPLVG